MSGQAFGSADWATALREEINTSSEYRNAAASWGIDFNGNVLLVFEPDPKFAETKALLLRLAAGHCDGAEFIPGTAHGDAGFTLSAPMTVWREILERKTLAATAILTGRLRVDGDRMTLLKHTAAARALIHCAASMWGQVS